MFCSRQLLNLEREQRCSHVEIWSLILGRAFFCKMCPELERSRLAGDSYHDILLERCKPNRDRLVAPLKLNSRRFETGRR